MPTARGTGTTVLLLDGRPVTRPPARGMGHNGWRMSKNVAAGTAQPGQEPAGQAIEQATEADLSKANHITDEVFQENPGFGEIPADERARLIAEVPGELRAS